MSCNDVLGLHGWYFHSMFGKTVLRTGDGAVFIVFGGIWLVNLVSEERASLSDVVGFVDDLLGLIGQIQQLYL